MPKTKISDYSSTANDNSDINSINIAEGCAPSNINDAIREMMAQLKNYQAGLSGDTVSAVGSVIVKGTSTTGGDIQLYEDTDNGTNYVALKAPANISTNVTWVLPSADGSANQILKTDGSGNLSFTTASVGDVTASGNNAFTGANTFFNATGQTFAPATANDGIIVQGRAGGSSSYRVTLAPTTLTDNRNLTLPDASTTVVGTDTTQTLTNKTISGSSNTLTNISLTTSVTGTLPLANGGTGLTSPGTSGNVLTSNGTSWVSQAPTGGGTVTLNEYTSSGTWTKPAGANFVMVEAWGAGGGGGSGRKNSTASSTSGGSGGGGGAYAYRLFKASDLSATETITIGAGGAGGASVTTNSTAGNSGSAGGDTSFGTKLYAFGGGGGNGGQTTTANGGVGGGVASSGANAGLPSSSTSGGHFGTDLAGNGSGGLSGFGGATGGGTNAGGAGAGGVSYQGGPGGGGGGGIGAVATNPSGEGGGIIARATSTGNGALQVVYPGASGNNGSGRQGASGGACGNATNVSITKYGIAYGNSTFAAVEITSGLISKSANGTTGWARVAGPSNTNIAAIMHDGTQFVLIGPGAVNVWTTTDFSTYTQKTGFGATLSFNVQSCKYLNSKYFVWSTSAIYYSSDLVTWTLLSTGNNGNINDITWSGTNYVVVSQTSPRARYSSNLTSWSSSTGADTAGNLAVTSNGSGTVVIAVSGTGVVYSTDHGVTFSAAATAVTIGSGAGLNYLNSTYILGCNSTAINTSTDGTNWTLQTSTGTTATVNGAAWNGTTYVVPQSTGAGTTNIAQTSTNLTTWTNRTVTAIDGAGGTGGTGGQPGGGGGGGGTSTNAGGNSGAGGTGGAGLVRVYSW